MFGFLLDTTKEKHFPKKENRSKIPSDRDVQSSTEDLMEQETDLDLFDACRMGNPNLVRRLLEDGRIPMQGMKIVNLPSMWQRKAITFVL